MAWSRRPNHAGFALQLAAEFLTAGLLVASGIALGIDCTCVQVWLGDRWFTVVGILDPLPLAASLGRSALIGRPAARDLFDASKSTSQIYVRADPEDVEGVQLPLAATANPDRPEEVSVSRPSDALQAGEAAAVACAALSA